MKDKEITIKDLPYTVVGSTSIPTPKNSILFTAKGIKAIADKAEEDDLIRYEAWNDVTEEGNNVKHYSKWTIIKKEKEKK